MAWNIAFFTGADTNTHLIYGKLISSLSYVPTGTGASPGSVPSNATLARITSDADGYVSNNGTAASTTNGTRVTAGSSIDIQVNSTDGLSVA